jgi:hypothetical protein
VEEELRSDGALTIALLGLIAEEAVLATPAPDLRGF